jgi:hypothetical protein
MKPRSIRLSEWFYDQLLDLYPDVFVQAYGEQARQDFAHELSQHRSRFGLFGMIGYWLYILFVDLPISLVRTHLAARRVRVEYTIEPASWLLAIQFSTPLIVLAGDLVRGLNQFLGYQQVSLPGLRGTFSLLPIPSGAYLLILIFGIFGFLARLIPDRISIVKFCKPWLIYALGSVCGLTIGHLVGFIDNPFRYGNYEEMRNIANFIYNWSHVIALPVFLCVVIIIRSKLRTIALIAIAIIGMIAFDWWMYDGNYGLILSPPVMSIPVDCPPGFGPFGGNECPPEVYRLEPNIMFLMEHWGTITWKLAILGLPVTIGLRLAAKQGIHALVFVMVALGSAIHLNYQPPLGDVTAFTTFHQTMALVFLVISPLICLLPVRWQFKKRALLLSWLVVFLAATGGYLLQDRIDYTGSGWDYLFWNFQYVMFGYLPFLLVLWLALSLYERQLPRTYTGESLPASLTEPAA